MDSCLGSICSFSLSCRILLKRGRCSNHCSCRGPVLPWIFISRSSGIKVFVMLFLKSWIELLYNKCHVLELSHLTCVDCRHHDSHSGEHYPTAFGVCNLLPSTQRQLWVCCFCCCCFFKVCTLCCIYSIKDWGCGQLYTCLPAPPMPSPLSQASTHYKRRWPHSVLVLVAQ